MKGKMNNKGYTLVELLLTLAIFSIVMLGIAMIMRTTSVSYKDGTNEVTMQTEAQIVANQIEEIFMDGTRNYCTGSVSGNKYYGITSDNASHFIIYKATDEEIWYQSKGPGETTPDEEAGGNWSLMAENVASIKIDGYSITPDSEDCDNMITVTVGLDRDGYVYTATKDIYFRNSIENKAVTMLETGSSEEESSGMAYKDVYVERYEVLDLCKDLELDITKSITITGLGASTYKLVVPAYNTSGNKDTYNAITGISDAVGADTATQVAYCQTQGAIAITPTSSLNENLTGSVTNTENVTVVGTSITGSVVRVRLLTEQVKFRLADNPSGPEGIILLTDSSSTMPRYTWITVEGINYTDMVHLYGKEFRYTMAIYEDADADNTMDTGEMKSSGINLYKVTNSNIDFDFAVGPNGGASNFAYQLDVALAPDTESGDLLINIPSTITQDSYKTSLSSGNARIAFVIETPKAGGCQYNVVDMVLLYQAPNMDISKYDGGYTSSVNANYLGSDPFAVTE